jgi:diaminopimelate decarboxylase
MSKTKIQIQDEDIAKAEIALRRAAVRAKKIAEETRTPLIVYENGRVVKKYPWKEKSKQARKTG